MLRSDKKPLIVFINKRSGSFVASLLSLLKNTITGGQQGDAVIQALLGLLNPLQIFDLGNGGPVPGYFFLLEFALLTQYYAVLKLFALWSMPEAHFTYLDAVVTVIVTLHACPKELTCALSQWNRHHWLALLCLR